MQPASYLWGRAELITWPRLVWRSEMKVGDLVRTKHIEGFGVIVGISPNGDWYTLHWNNGLSMAVHCFDIYLMTAENEVWRAHGDR